MIDRRRLLGASAAAATLVSPILAALPASALAFRNDADAALDALLTRQFEQGLDRNPEGVTDLGLDVGARAGQRALLNDRSPEAFKANRSSHAWR